MALTCPVEFDVATLRSEIQTMYGRVATAPDAEFHFHRGPAYAVSRLGYDHNELAGLPAAVTSSFAGVGNPHAIAPIDVSAVVLDIGCGAGTDLLLAARHIGPQGRAIGVDMTAAMRERAMAGANAARPHERRGPGRRCDMPPVGRRERRHRDLEWGAQPGAK